MSEKIVNLSSSDFDDVIKKERFVLVDFWAAWCAPCKMLAPIIDKVADEYDGKLVVGKVNIDEQQELAMRYGIQSIPTVILFKDGKIAAKEVGVKPLKSFTSLLDNEIA